MSIKPIDLQTLFLKMDQVSKEQSLARDQAANQQAAAARAQVAKELQQDHQVVKTPENSEALEVKEDESKNEQEESRRKKGNDENEADTENDREIVTDPHIGRHVDLSG